MNTEKDLSTSKILLVGDNRTTMRKEEILPIGTWGFINGNRLIDEKSWKRNFPQGIFGKIVEHEVNRNSLYKGTYYMVRVYVGVSRRKNGNWQHQRVHPKYFQKW